LFQKRSVYASQYGEITSFPGPEQRFL